MSDVLRDHDAGFPSEPASSNFLTRILNFPRLEQQRSQLMGTQFNLENMAFQQENMATTVETVNAMKAGTEIMKKQMQNVFLFWA